MKLKSIFYILFVFSLTIGITGFCASMGVDAHHDGILLKPAIDMLHGKMLFRDTFTQYGALTSIVQALALHYFGEYLIVIKYLTVAFYGITSIFLWIFWRKFLSPILTTLSVVIWIMLFNFYNKTDIFLPWSFVYSLSLQTIALYLFILWIQYKKHWLVGLSGVCAALAFWFRQTTGVYFFAAVIVFWIITKLKKRSLPSIIPFYFGFFFIHVVFFTWLILNNSFGDWWLMSISFANSWQKAVATQYRFPIFQISKLLPLSESALSIWVLFPAVVLYQGYNLYKRKMIQVKDQQLFATAIICLFSWLQYYPMSDPGHASWAATPMIGFYIYFAWNNKYKRKKHFVVFFLLILLLVPDMFNRMKNAKHKFLASYITFTDDTVLKGMKETKENYQYFQAIAKSIRAYEKKDPNTFVVELSTDALYPLFGTNNRNCSRFTVDWLWEVFDKNIEKEYTVTTMACVKKYKPLVVTDADHYNPPNYNRLTARPTTSCIDINHKSYLMAPTSQ